MMNNYINKAVLFLKKLDGSELKTFFLLYGISYCNKYINLTSLLDNYKEINLDELKNEAQNKLSFDIFQYLDEHSDSAIKILDWLRKNPPPETTEDILGTIYLVLSEDKKRKKLGEHYTRIDLINLIFTEYKIEENINKTIIDPACGSGNFLVIYVYRILSKYKNSPEILREIIEKIYSRKLITGVDIQEFTCLITKLRLLMTMTKFSGKIRPNEKLPIFQLDSLSDDDSEVLKDNQYDIVATNPPYLRYHSLSEDKREAYRKRYFSAKGKFDLYTLFIEKSIKLSKNKTGKVALVCSNKFMTAAYGKSIRDYIKQNINLTKVLDLSDIFPFKAAVLSAVYFFEAPKKDLINEPRWDKVIQENERLFVRQLGTVYLGDTWRYTSLKTEVVFQKIMQQPKAKELKEYIQSILVGIQTTADDVFCKYMTREFIEKNYFEKELFFPMLRGKNLKKWGYHWTGDIEASDTFVLYPYIEENGTTQRIQLDKYPNVMRYLLENKSILKQRTYIKEKGTKEWFEPWVERSHNTFKNVKILTPDLASECRFSLDTSGFFFNGTVYSIRLMEGYGLDDYKFLLGILNSNITLFIHKQLNPIHLHSKKYRFQSPVMKKYPIIFLNKRDSEYKKLVALVDDILRASCEGECLLEKEKELNRQIYKIYNLDQHDVEIIEEFLDIN